VGATDEDAPRNKQSRYTYFMYAYVHMHYVLYICMYILTLHIYTPLIGEKTMMKLFSEERK
jgi:hypothetical protein